MSAMAEESCPILNKCSYQHKKDPPGCAVWPGDNTEHCTKWPRTPVILSSCGKRSCVRLWSACLRGGHYHVVEMKRASYSLPCSINQASSILEGPGPMCVKLHLRVFAQFRTLLISYFCQTAPPGLSLDAGVGSWSWLEGFHFLGVHDGQQSEDAGLSTHLF